MSFPGHICFAEWYRRVKEQGERCTWAWYNGPRAEGDFILLQTYDKKLQQKILAKISHTRKYGLTYKQRSIWVVICRKPPIGQIGRANPEITNSLANGHTCTRPTHAEGNFPCNKVEWFQCGLLGHFKGSSACKKKKNGGKERKKEKVNQVIWVSVRAKSRLRDSITQTRLCDTS